jgi:hypothetical protein
MSWLNTKAYPVRELPRLPRVEEQISEVQRQIEKELIGVQPRDSVTQIKNLIKTLTHRQMKSLCEDLWSYRDNGPNRDAIELKNLPDILDAWAHEDIVAHDESE